MDWRGSYGASSPPWRKRTDRPCSSWKTRAAGGGTSAADLDELVLLLTNLDPARVGICLDTCHAFVAGYDLRDLAGWQSTLAAITGKVGLERLKVIHANDSRGDLGSGLDRHEHIGAGFLGESAFAAMGRLPELGRMTVILETPQDSPEDDPRNLAAIRRLTVEGP